MRRCVVAVCSFVLLLFAAHALPINDKNISFRCDANRIERAAVKWAIKQYCRRFPEVTTAVVKQVQRQQDGLQSTAWLHLPNGQYMTPSGEAIWYNQARRETFNRERAAHAAAERAGQNHDPPVDLRDHHISQDGNLAAHGEPATPAAGPSGGGGNGIRLFGKVMRPGVPSR